MVFDVVHLLHLQRTSILSPSSLSSSTSRLILNLSSPRLATLVVSLLLGSLPSTSDFLRHHTPHPPTTLTLLGVACRTRSTTQKTTQKTPEILQSLRALEPKRLRCSALRAFVLNHCLRLPSGRKVPIGSFRLCPPRIPADIIR